MDNDRNIGEFTKKTCKLEEKGRRSWGEIYITKIKPNPKTKIKNTETVERPADQAGEANAEPDAQQGDGQVYVFIG